MTKNPAFSHKKIDTRNKKSVVDALTSVIDATGYSRVDWQKWVALVQSRLSSDDDDADMAAGADWDSQATARTPSMYSVTCWTPPRPSSMTLATQSRTLLTTPRTQLGHDNKTSKKEQHGKG